MGSGNFAKGVKGAAGVHLVVAQLSLRGCVALPTTRNVKAVDVVAFNESLRSAFMQVKSTDKPHQGWPVYTVKSEEGWEKEVREAISLGDRFFYVFVSLPSSSEVQPEYYVVPSADVAQMVVDGMKGWLASKAGRKAERQLCALRPDVLEKYTDN